MFRKLGARTCEDTNANDVCDVDETGCTIELACNFDPGAVFSDPAACDFVSCLAFGCTDENACNFDATANYDDGSCGYPAFPYDCNGECISDTDNDGICDEFETPGCTDEDACNYSSGATQDDGSCEFDCQGCTSANACNFDAEALIDDGSCEYESCLALGCTDSAQLRRQRRAERRLLRFESRLGTWSSACNTTVFHRMTGLVCLQMAVMTALGTVSMTKMAMASVTNSKSRDAQTRTLATTT